MTKQNWGLDPSWYWLSIKAAQSQLYGEGTFFWTHGPLFFLDTQQLFWKEGLILALIFRLFVAISLYLLIFRLLDSVKLKKIYSRVIATILFSTLVFQSIAPTLTLVVIALIVAIQPKILGSRISKFTPLLLGFFLTIELFTKFLYFSLLSVIAFGILLNGKEKIKNLLFVGTSFASSMLIVGFLSGFTPISFIQFLRANFEFTAGYKAMAIEVQYYSFGYLTFPIAITFLLLIASRTEISTVNKLLIPVTVYIAFVYGFTRHDGHSSFTFFWILLLGILFSAVCNKTFAWIATSVIALLFVMSTAFSIQGVIDFTPRIQASSDYLRLLDPRYRAEEKQEDLSGIVNQAGIQTEILSEVKNNAVVILPWDQVAAYGYNLNLKTPPVPQPYAAYTPWLDEKNSEYFVSESAPQFILLSQPKAIDGRNFWWESPKTQFTIFCNYEVARITEKWLLLERRNHKICSLQTPNSSQSVFAKSMILKEDFEGITLLDVEIKRNIFEKISHFILKDFIASRISVNGKSYNLVTENSKQLLISVPVGLDYPQPWSIGSATKITSTETIGMKVVQIPIIPSK